MVRIAADENLHMVFYRDILGAALKIRPSEAVRAIVDEVLAFEMPGAGIPGFVRKAADDREGRHLRPAGPPRRGPAADRPPLAACFELSGLDAAAEEARHRLVEHLEQLDAAARRFEERVARSGATRLASG